MFGKTLPGEGEDTRYEWRNYALLHQRSGFT